jgi:hypothetical protein
MQLPKKPVYKFLHSKHLSKVLNDGTLKFGNLSHYRGLEHDQWIADRLEGSVQLDPQGMVITEHENKLDHMLPSSLAGRHVHVASGGTVSFAPGVRITIQHPEVYLFSASSGDLEQLTAAMCRKDAEAYDGCIHIADIAWLAHRVYFKGKVVELGDARVRNVFSELVYSEVTYEALSRTPEMERAPEASPLLKDISFAAQSEIRIVLVPRQEMAHSMLTVRVPRPAQIFKEVFRDRPIS